MLDVYLSLQKMYFVDDGNIEVFYFKNATVTFTSFTHEPEVVKFKMQNAYELLSEEFVLPFGYNKLF